jgi:hypothetical protein
LNNSSVCWQLVTLALSVVVLWWVHNGAIHSSILDIFLILVVSFVYVVYVAAVVQSVDLTSIALR